MMAVPPGPDPENCHLQRIKLIKIRFDWGPIPPQVHLVVMADQAVAPKRVGLLETFVASQTGQRFQLIVQVLVYERIQSGSALP